jgi:hypothetical protein
MANVYNNENVNGSTTNTVDLSGATKAVRVLFNNAPITLTGSYYTATYSNVAGAGIPSGVGAIVYDTAWDGETVYTINTDRTSFAITLASGAVTPVNNGFMAWGPTERRLRNLEQF